MSCSTGFRPRHLATGMLLAGVISLPAVAEVFSPLPTDITEPGGIYFPLAPNPLELDVATVIGTGPCVVGDYSGCTLEDVNNDLDSQDDFKPEIKVHIVMDTFPDDGLTSNAAMRQRGNSARFAPQKSYRIKLDSKKDLWRGERRLQLNKHPWDLSRIANKLSFDLMRQVPHLPSLRTDFVHMFVDNVDFGLFTHVEHVGKEYLQHRGWDKDSNVYKADDFRFVMNDVFLLDANGQPLDPYGFQFHLEIKRGDSHFKLLEMIQAVNDESNDFDADVMARYFNKNNFLSWVAASVLTGNRDIYGIDSSNYYLLNRLNEDTFYFLPWDYDEAWLEGTWDVLNNIHISRAWSGVSMYWSSLLHRRYLKQPGALDELIEAVTFVKDNYITEERITSLLDAYLPIVYPLVSTPPDLWDLPVTGEIPTLDEYMDNYNNMYTAMQANYQKFLDSAEYPMGFWLRQAQLDGDYLKLVWTPSYDLQGDNISYDVQIATSPDFSASAIVAEVDGLAVPHLDYWWDLPQGDYFLRVIARDDDNPTDHWQIAYNEYQGRDFHGVMPFHVAVDGKPKPPPVLTPEQRLDALAATIETLAADVRAMDSSLFLGKKGKHHGHGHDKDRRKNRDKLAKKIDKVLDKIEKGDLRKAVKEIDKLLKELHKSGKKQKYLPDGEARDGIVAVLEAARDELIALEDLL